MFRSYSRFDWVDDLHAAAGDSAWPDNLLSSDEQINRCGRWAIDPGSGRSRTTGHTIGFISHKLEATKPSNKGDVVWGFDPYRFNKEQIQSAIHWVLGQHFGLILR
jgi:hypothetical protein